VSTQITGKFKSVWEIHSSLTTPDPWLRGSTQSWLVWGTSYLGNSADTRADQGLTQVTWSTNQGWLRSAGQLRLPINRWPSQHNETCPVLFSWELFVCTDWGFSMIFLQLQGECQGVMQRQVMARTPIQAQRHHESVCPKLHDFSMWLGHYEFKPQRAIQPK